MASEGNPAAQRWRQLVTDRLEERDRLAPGLGSLSGSFWDRRADRYAAGMPRADLVSDPLLRRLRRVTGPSGTAIDVGAGAGRFSLSLAEHVGHVTAVDPSEAMLAILRREAEEMGATNVETVPGTWEEADTSVADVVFSAFVLTLVPEARPFLAKLDAAARGHVFLYLGAYCADAVLDPLWRHFHGATRTPGPSYLDALAVLRELGIAPEVKVVELPNRRRYATVNEAVERYRDWLLLDDTPEVRGELEELLPTWLMGRRGAFRSPMRSQAAAIIHWRPAGRGARRPGRS